METLLVLTYTAFCVTIFKVFKIPLNKWTVPTAVLGGVVMVGSMVLVMNYNHPFTHIGGQIFNTTPIVSSVRGKVVEVNVVANQPLKKGEVLFKIDPTPFKAEVVNKEAALVASQQNVLQLESVYKAAQATAIKATAERDKAQREYQRYQKGFSRGAFTEQQVDTKQQAYRAAQASLEAALANQNQAELAYTSEINGENTSVARAKAALTQAQFNLDETTVYAPTDGYVSQLALRPGMMAVPLPLAPVMTFVHTEDKYYVGAFRQNASQRLKAGFEADFIFRALPGKTFKGEVVELIPAIAEGQIQARGSLLGTNSLNTNGRLMVKLRILDDISSYNLPLGSAAEIAVYSPHFEHISMMRKILIRMKSWQNYLYVDH